MVIVHRVCEDHFEIFRRISKSDYPRTEYGNIKIFILK